MAREKGAEKTADALFDGVERTRVVPIVGAGEAVASEEGGEAVKKDEAADVDIVAGPVNEQTVAEEVGVREPKALTSPKRGFFDDGKKGVVSLDEEVAAPSSVPAAGAAAVVGGSSGSAGASNAVTVLAALTPEQVGEKLVGLGLLTLDDGQLNAIGIEQAYLRQIVLATGAVTQIIEASRRPKQVAAGGEELPHFSSEQ
ncbi:hypothetical protein HDU96_009086 [Phlyctochytrium bullatum]|nr:hypothetical protein HDU96_009086 [Phlyctochytrium bullatum]